ncbi:unnamed protein product, partial [Larinioides sclopetarius]
AKFLHTFTIFISISHTKFYRCRPKGLRVINFANMGLYRPPDGQPCDGFGPKFYTDRHL